jgi:hypothetical protein
LNYRRSSRDFLRVLGCGRSAIEFSDALVRFRAGPHGLHLVIDVLQYFNPPSAKTAAWRDCLSSVDQAGTSAWRPVPRVAVAAAQALVALAPLRAEVAVGQRHAAAAAEVAAVARAALSAAPAREPHWSEAWFALPNRRQAADHRWHCLCAP